MQPKSRQILLPWDQTRRRASARTDCLASYLDFGRAGRAAPIENTLPALSEDLVLHPSADPEFSAVERDEGWSLSDSDVAEAEAALRDRARAEFPMPVIYERLRRRNVGAARGQEVLSLMVAEFLLRRRVRMDGEGSLFWQQIREVEEEYQDCVGERLSGLRADWLRRVEERDALFPIQVPQVGDQGSVDAPALLMRSAIDSACRVADGIRGRRAELTTDAVLRRIQGVVAEKVRALG